MIRKALSTALGAALCFGLLASGTRASAQDAEDSVAAPAPATARAHGARVAPVSRHAFLPNGFPDVQGVGEFKNGYPLLGGFTLGADGRPTSLSDGKTTIRFHHGKPIWKNLKKGRPIVPGVFWTRRGVPCFSGTKIFLESTDGKKVGCSPAVIFELGGLPEGYASIVPARSRADIEATAAARTVERAARVRELEVELTGLEGLVASTRSVPEALRALQVQIAEAKENLAAAQRQLAHVPAEKHADLAVAAMTRTVLRFLSIQAQAQLPPRAPVATPGKTTPGKTAPGTTPVTTPAKTTPATTPSTTTLTLTGGVALPTPTLILAPTPTRTKKPHHVRSSLGHTHR